MLAIRTILHPTDFSGNSALAFRLACALARDYDARLIVLHVAAPPVVVYGEGVLPIPTEDYLGTLRDKLLEVQPHGPKIKVEHHLIEGEAATEILRAAEEMNADVIFMGTHGRTGLARLVMGSVAEQVVRRAPCPVLTIKPPLPAAHVAAEATVAAAADGAGAAH